MRTAKEMREMTECVTIPLSGEMFIKLYEWDKTLIGTEEYMGLAYFWSHEYKHYLRAATCLQRKNAHDRILRAGLELSGESDEHLRIIESATLNAARERRNMGILS